MAVRGAGKQTTNLKLEKPTFLPEVEAKTVEKHVVLNNFETKTMEKHLVLNHFEPKTVENTWF